MQKRTKSKIISGIAWGQIYLLVMMTFAFAFIINLEMGSGAKVSSTTIAGTITSAPKGATGSIYDLKGGFDVTEAVSFSTADFVPREKVTAAKLLPDGKNVEVTSKIGSETYTGTISKADFEKLVSKQGFKIEDPVKPAESKVLGIGPTVRGGWAHLSTGLNYALLVGGAIQMIGSLAGLDSKTTKSLSIAAMSGIFVGKAIGSLGASGFNIMEKILPGKFGNFLTSGTGQFVVGAGVAIVVFLMLYKKTKTKIVTFQCLPWEAPLGGANCDDCNKDPMRPCSEYRCRSLGQGCEIRNKGTAKEQCIWISRGDVTSPTITPWTEALSEGLKYRPLATRPAERGTGIINTESGKECLKPFTPLRFGIVTNEPAQCKMDYEIKNYTDLQFYFGGSNYYETNHTQIMKLPSPQSSDGITAPIFKNDGTLQLWVQCQDANGNKNEDFYLIEFCVEKSPDTTAPIIESFSILDGSSVKYNVDSVEIDAYLNEPAQCKWSRQDKSYENMENSMKCENESIQINGNLQYACTSNLTGIKNMEANEFYFRCIDAEGNKNVASKKLTLLGSQLLNIFKINPNETIYGSTSTVVVRVELETEDGASEGRAKCFYKGDFTADYTEMFETNNYMHRQTLDLPSGTYEYSFKCIDAGGNIAEKNATFRVFVDNKAPQVTRAYKDQVLKIITDEDAECFYSVQNCNFEINKGVRMDYSNINIKNQLFAPWEVGKIYYVKCMDKYGNMPLPNECSVIVSPRPLSVVVGGEQGNPLTNLINV